jgi:sugar/nucleoside kinase (ribokinase family)
VIVNPAPAQRIDVSAFAGIDYFIPNETEAETITGLPLRSIDEARACATWLMSRGLGGVIITLGARGAQPCEPLCRPLDDADRHAKVVRHARAVRGGVGGAGDHLSKPLPAR